MNTVKALRLTAAISLLIAVLLVFHEPLRQAWDVLRAEAEVFGGGRNGFMVQVSSTPSGATLRIDGQDRGSTPFIGNVPCRTSQKVVIEVKKAGAKDWRREVECRHGKSLQVTARLE